MATGRLLHQDGETPPVPEISNPESLFAKLRSNDPAAVAECLNRYGAFVWRLARTHCNNTPNAEECAEEIFRDIWKYAVAGTKSDRTEMQQIARIAANRVTRRCEELSAKSE